MTLCNLNIRKTKICKAIQDERDYQDNKWGSIEEHPHQLYEWLRIMENEIKEAQDALYYQEDFHSSYFHAISELVQAIAVGHAALEQHGVVSGHSKIQTKKE